MTLDKQRILDMLDQVAKTKGQDSLQKANDLVAYLSAERTSDEEDATAGRVVAKDTAPGQPEPARGH